jgi:hypothetical protein
MDIEELLRRLDKAWQDFQESHQGLSDEDLMEPGVTGSWSVRDIIAHVTTWEEEALKYLPMILKGDTPPRYSVMYGGIDAFNALTTKQKQNLSLPETFREMKNTHRRLVDFIKNVPEDQIRTETRFRHRLRADTYSHYPKHAAAIRRWRDGRANFQSA